MATLATLFQPDHARYEGVRPFNIWGLRLFYGLMFALVAPQAWMQLLTHQGPWDPTRAVAWCVWAAYPTLSLLGVFKPLKMLPVFLFMLFYKSLWLIIVAYPLWSTGQLAGSSADEMAHVFMWVPLPALLVPWGYVARTYLPLPRRADRVAPLRAS
ncbi:MAG: hypothetical protein JWL98_576 [Xanthomonadaceae bacterium]|nr:hypothetical protein [Xanthomonadaceae bacterium]